jgi:hypothetical protein
MDFARQEARAEVSPSRASPPQLPPSPKIRPRARCQSQAEEERGEGGVRREPGERGENGHRSPGSQLGFAYQTGANGPSGPGRPFLARIKQTLCLRDPPGPRSRSRQSASRTARHSHRQFGTSTPCIALALALAVSPPAECRRHSPQSPVGRCPSHSLSRTPAGSPLRSLQSPHATGHGG